MPPRIVHAPFTASQVESLNGYQYSLAGHPFTCPGAHGDFGEVVLVAHEGGWRCPCDCGYAQTWAHDFMVDGSWREAAAEIGRALSPDRPGDLKPCSRCGGSGSEPADGRVTERQRDVIRTMGTVVTALSRSLKAAWIELEQDHPEAAKEWIANAIPGEAWDGDEWDGTETAQQWADRTDPEVRRAG